MFWEGSEFTHDTASSDLPQYLNEHSGDALRLPSQEAQPTHISSAASQQAVRYPGMQEGV